MYSLSNNFSSDKTPEIAQKYGKVYSYGRDPGQKNIFAVPYQRNFGMRKGKGEYVYYIDSDMRLTPTIVETCVHLIRDKKADAVIVPEEAAGEGFWAKCRTLEKACYNASPHSLTDSARFLKKKVFEKLGGLDATLGGGDDWDFQHRLNVNGYKTIKSPVHIFHYDGSLSLKRILQKEFVYGKNTLAYFKKYSNNKTYLFSQFSFLRKDFLLNSDKLIKDPVHALGMFIMKTIEYVAVSAGILYTLIKKEEVRIHNK
jgi:glycosyltransferase involved in cell wall biosynthesis